MSGRVGRGFAVAGLAVVAGLLPSTAAAQQGEYRWALPDWRETWSGGPLADDRGFTIRASDDAVYVAGVSGSGNGGGDLLLQRYSLDGRLVWSREWGGAELDQAQGMALASDGIYVVGSEESTGDGRTQSALVRFDYAGNVVDERIWNVGAKSAAQSIVESGDSLYVAGLSHPTAANRDLYISRFRKARRCRGPKCGLSRVWTKRWGGAKWDEAWDLDTDGRRLYVVGYTTDAATDKTDNLLLIADAASGTLTKEVVWGGPGNDEARAAELEGTTLWIAGGGQRGTSGDAYLAKGNTSGAIAWTRYASGLATGAYGVSVGERGIYVAGGSYDFPAGGDAAILRFDREGKVEWSQIFGQPGFWDWGFDVDARNGKFYVAGTLFTPGEEWYEILTVAYDEQFDTAGLTDTVSGVAADDPKAKRALDAFWLGDMLRWARGPKQAGESGEPRERQGQWADENAQGETPPGGGEGAARLYWSGASDFGRRSGEIYVDTSRDPPVGEENAVDALTGVARDYPSNPALVRDYTGIRGSLLDGFIRFRYFISHDRLIPQGGFLSVGETTVPLPPPPV